MRNHYFSLKLNSFFLVSWITVAGSANSASPLTMDVASSTVELATADREIAFNTSFTMYCSDPIRSISAFNSEKIRAERKGYILSSQTEIWRPRSL